jgi:hypothetical protein
MTHLSFKLSRQGDKKYQPKQEFAKRSKGEMTREETPCISFLEKGLKICHMENNISKQTGENKRKAQS